MKIAIQASAVILGLSLLSPIGTSTADAATRTPETSLIKGHARTVGGGNVAGIKITVLRGNKAVARDTSDAKGYFSIKVKPGTYKVRLSDPQHRYIDYTLPRDGSSFPFEAGRQNRLTGKLVPASSITGKVFSDAGIPLKRITVEAISNGKVVQETVSNASGKYFLKGLPAGEYLVRYSDMEGSYLEESWGEDLTPGVASSIILNPGSKKSGTSAHLARTD